MNLLWTWPVNSPQLEIQLNCKPVIRWVHLSYSNPTFNQVLAIGTKYLKLLEMCPLDMDAPAIAKFS